MSKLTFIQSLFIFLIVFSVNGTGPILDSVNDLTGIDQDETNPAGNTVNSLISDHIVVPNNFFLLDDFQDSTDSATAWGGPWYVYDDRESGGNSEMEEYAVKSGVGHNNSKGLKLGYTLGDSIGSGDDKYGPFVGIGVDVKDIPQTITSPEQEVRDLSAVSKIKYYFKGPAHEFHFQSKNIIDYDTYHARVPASGSWTLVSLDFNTTDFKQAGWGTPKSFTESIKQVQGFIWNITDQGGINLTDTIYLDEFSVEANFPDPGIAVIGINNNTVGGNWQFDSTGGTSWVNFSALSDEVSDTTALLLKNAAKIRFAPDNTNGGAPTIIIRAWDLSEGRANGSIADTKRADSTDQTVWSHIPRVASIAVGGDPPIITKDPDSLTVNENETAIFVVEASSSTPMTYRWQENDNGWKDITGETDDTLDFQATLADDNSYYRCVVSNSFGSDTSGIARLDVLPPISKPHIIAPAMNDTVVGEKEAAFSFGKAEAVGNPVPYYIWYFMETPGSIPDSIYKGEKLVLQNTDQDDEGYYFFIAVNSQGSDTSDTAFLDVYEDPVFTQDLDSTKSLLNNTSAFLKVVASGAGTVRYQWYKNGRAIPGQTGDSLFLGTVTIASHHDTVYSCNAWNATATIDTVGRVVSSNECVLKVGKYSNPFELVARRLDEHDTSRVVLTISSSQDLSSFPTGDNPLQPYAEHVWVLYQTKDFPEDTGDVVEILKYTTLSIKQDPDNSISKTITVKPYASGEELHCFSSTILWTDPTASDTLFPLVNKQHNRVFLGDTVSPDNNLSLSGQYITGTDNATITVSNTSSLSDTWDKEVVFQCSDYADFSSITSSVVKSVSDLKSGGDVYQLTMKVGNAPFEKHIVYSRCQVVGKNQATSIYRETSFYAGQDRPVYTGTLQATATTMADAVKLAWDLPDPGTDSVIIWFSRDSIPVGEYSIPLPQQNAHGVDATSMVVDTIKNLSPLTLYYFSLQILRDGLWSRTTAAATDTATTTQPDSSLKVPNVVSIDSAWFDTTLNAITVEWTVDTSVTPDGAWLQYGYTYSVDPDTSYKDTTKGPGEWVKVAGAGGTFPIFLNYDVVFDTTYTVAMWLRAQNDSATGPNAPPGDSVTYKVTIPPFTWQPVIFTSGDVDTQYAANKMIILQGTVSFDHKDTLYAFNPEKLPEGFVSVGGVGFCFKNTSVQIPPVVLGMKWGKLSSGVTEDDIALYQYKNGDLFVRHGFTKSNGVVWDTIRDNEINAVYLVCADTLEPTVTVTQCSDTVNPQMIIPTKFFISDNISNVQYTFRYGPGSEGYSYGETKTLSTTSDSLREIIKDTNNVINKSFGVRARIIVDDAVHDDTVDISRCVRTEDAGFLNATAKEWLPMRTASGLVETELAVIFNKSISTGEPWEYDTYKYRLYRWYNTEEDAQNSWIEYSDNEKSVFDLIPGRLIWFKAAEDHLIRLGPGVTTTLKEPYRIVLRSKNWTDLSLPFKFSVHLRDVLETTGSAADDLDVYRWVKVGSHYEADGLYIASIDDIEDVKDTLKSQVKYDGLTIYNYRESDVTLLIPPISLPLSKYSNRPPVRKERKHDSWNVHFLWTRDRGADDPFYRRIRCGYKKSNEETEFGLYPPTMSKVFVGFVNDDNRLCGWALKHELDKKQGVTFTVGMQNQRDTEADLEYYLGNLEMLPENYIAQVLNTATKQYEECTLENPTKLSIASKSSLSRMLVIGTPQYLHHVLATILPIKLLKAFPNPFNGRMTIHYRIPADIREVTFTLYNLRGQQIWQGIESGKLTPGEHIIAFSGKNSIGTPLSAGVYIMRLTAKSKTGRFVYGGEKRITCLK